jgi:hypothetical protein
LIGCRKNQKTRLAFAQNVQVRRSKVHLGGLSQHVVAIFRKHRVPRKKMQVKENIKESNRCNCGRSPTGECIGCYFLTGAEFETRLEEYLAEQKDKNNAVGT